MARILALPLGVVILLANARLFAEDAVQVDADQATLQAAGVHWDGPDLLDFLRRRTVRETDRAHLELLIQQLGDEEFLVREKASTGLIHMGLRALPALRSAQHSADPEVVERAAQCQEIIEEHQNPQVVCAAIRMIGRRKPQGAVEVLLQYAACSSGENHELEELSRAVTSVGIRAGVLDPQLITALGDAHPACRAVAGEVLASVPGRKADVSKLLTDRDLGVRTRVGLAMLRSRHRESIPVLIDLLAELPESQRGPIEETLYQLADGKGPPYVGGNDQTSRRKRRAGWVAWWQEHGQKLDLDKLNLEQNQLGLTLLVLYGAGNMGSVQEIDREGKTRWQIGNLNYPVDAQVLPGERVLITEYRARQVTERDFKGNVLWTYTAPTLVRGARRLANGNTLLVLSTRLLEIDREGKEVWKQAPGIGVAAATRLPDGGLVMASVTGQLQYLDAKGTVMRNINLGGNVYSLGGTLDVSPDGRVLVSLYNQNKVVEINAEGKQIWEASVNFPTSAVRLPNGNILVASRTRMAAIEIDRNGKEVSVHKTSTFLIKATRR